MKIVFFSADPGNHRFIEPIRQRFSQQGYETDLYTNWTSVEDADIYWFDFCDNNLIVATRDDKELLKGKKIIARLHAVEYYMGFHNSIDWSQVDELIFVSEHLKEMCGELPVRSHVIYNGIDMLKMQFKERSKGHIIGYAGNIVPTKGIIPMLYYFKDLVNMDASYRLKMVGLSRFHGREGEFMNHFIEVNGLKDKIEMNDEVADINKWLDDIDYLWQPSLAESFSLIVGEAMAKGIKPIINNFKGSQGLWPNDLIYSDFESFYKILDSPYESLEYRNFVEKYSLDKQMEQIYAII